MLNSYSGYLSASCRRWLFTIVALISTTTNAISAEFIPLGFLPGENFSWAFDVSEDGRVVAGRSQNVTAGSNNSGGQAMLWMESTGWIGLDEPGFERTGSTFSINRVTRLSGDGQTLIGLARDSRAQDPPLSVPFIYTQSAGMQAANDVANIEDGLEFRVAAVSFDGEIVGSLYDPDGPNRFQAVRWSAEEGIVELGFLPGGDSSNASLVSADGMTIVGTSGGSIFRWTEETGMAQWATDLDPLRFPNNMSADGTVLGGWDLISSSTDVEAYLWSEQTGVIGLGWLASTVQSDGSNTSRLHGINADGSIAVGFSGSGTFKPGPDNPARAFIWTEDAGMQDLQQLLIDEHGLGSALEGWNLLGPQNISADGRFIVGIGVNPDGNNEGWLVRLDAPIPEPSTSFLAAIGSIVVVGVRCQRRGKKNPCFS